MDNVAIEFDRVSKHYPMYHDIKGGIKHVIFNLPKTIKSFFGGKFTALEDISFQIKKGETFGIIGRNGAGKSTTLGLMARVMRPSKGKVTITGRIGPLLELGMGFQMELNGRDNILLNGILLGMTKRYIMGRIEEIIEFSGIREFIDQPLRTYSTGMVARLGFSVVAHLDPDILLIDEVLAVGDIAFQEKCIAKIQGFKKSGVTIVFVSHAMTHVSQICDRVALIDNHKLAKIGTPDEVIAAYQNSMAKA
jgi:lipopolysaccharide transport system ATP-binding protein